ncbi:MAG: CS1-pili formation C-terminal domain-containing protein, partial [Kangiellaceae bacterium]|nr:CS1-pili formation C-terminal domain-containing protein [Kangiellaceae bacterium]
DHVRGAGISQSSESTTRNSYSITSRFNLVSGGGEITLGGDKRNSAGVMLDLTSIEIEGLSFAVIINGSERTRVKAGETTFVALSPYQSYRLTLSPKGGSLVDFDNSPKEFTLYPGNVENFKWDIEQVKVVVMQLIDRANQVFANARLQHEYIYATTDDLGWVQMEIAKPGQYLFVKRNGEQCSVSIAPSHFRETVNFIGTVNCAD